MERTIRISNFKNYFTLLVFFLLIIFLIFVSPGFLNLDNLINVAILSFFVGVPAIGLASIMLTGLFDLSFVGIIGLISVITIKMIEVGISVPVVLVIGLGIAIGFELVNATLIIKFKIHPWLATIATMLATLGLERAISKGYFLTTSHSLFKTIRYGKFLGIPFTGWIFVVTFIPIYFLINKTTLGMHLYAIGGNEIAAKKAGIKCERLKFASFIIMGICIYVSSLLYVSQLSGYPPQAAYTNLNEVILSVFFGMSISRKNIITIHGAAIGAFVIALLANGLALSGISSYLIKLIEGCLIILLVIINSLGGEELVQLEK
ncbi:MAG TPA: ABC transporter permease [Defluviitoga sp.]|nr:ABC transporter permease [Defluviitoga sp.]